MQETSDLTFPLHESNSQIQAFLADDGSIFTCISSGDLPRSASTIPDTITISDLRRPLWFTSKYPFLPFALEDVEYTGPLFGPLAYTMDTVPIARDSNGRYHLKTQLQRDWFRLEKILSIVIDRLTKTTHHTRSKECNFPRKLGYRDSHPTEALTRILIMQSRDAFALLVAMCSFAISRRLGDDNGIPMWVRKLDGQLDAQFVDQLRSSPVANFKIKRVGTFMKAEECQAKWVSAMTRLNVPVWMCWHSKLSTDMLADPEVIKWSPSQWQIDQIKAICDIPRSLESKPFCPTTPFPHLHKCSSQWPDNSDFILIDVKRGRSQTSPHSDFQITLHSANAPDGSVHIPDDFPYTLYTRYGLLDDFSIPESSSPTFLQVRMAFGDIKSELHEDDLRRWRSCATNFVRYAFPRPSDQHPPPPSRDIDDLQIMIDTLRNSSVAISKFHDDQYIAKGSEGGANWVIVVDAATALQCVRAPWGPTTQRLACHLLARGISFHTFLPVHPASTHQTPNIPTTQGLGGRAPGYRPDALEYKEYERKREEFLRGPRGRAALMSGGIVWRLAVDSLGLNHDLVLAGPSEEAQHFGPGQDALIVKDDQLTNEEYDLICGVYRVSSMSLHHLRII